MEKSNGPAASDRLFAARPISEGAGRRAHLVGVCGSGMRALAEYLVDSGWRVSGSDQAPGNRARSALVRIGIDVVDGHHAGHVSRDIDLVVHSAAVPESNVERAAAAEIGIADLSYPQTLARCMAGTRVVAVAGTHGKTTTTAMLAWILRQAGRDPSVICGGEVPGLERAGWRGNGDLLVLEACEYGRHFLELRPRFAAVLNIEADHFDSYPNLNAAVDAYCEFLATVPADGGVVLGHGTPARGRLRNATAAAVETLGVDVPADWCARHVTTDGGHVRFELHHLGTAWADVELPRPGRHNVANAAAAAALSVRLGVPRTEVLDGLRSFPGVRRRFAECGRRGGVLWIDDYAHHPTAVRAVLTAARQECGARRVWCAFQPHQVSRTVALLSGFVSALQLADEVLVLPVYAARESAGIDAVAPSREIVRRLVAAGRPARFEPTLDRVLATLETEPRPGEVVVVTGAGDIERVCHEFTGRIRRSHAS
jgi:UDP-N-acetylmuramate--alanine ligase